jgi:serine phosphatase RsbU (regulator of sigma subunit)
MELSALRKKLKKAALISIAGVLFAAVFTIDVINWSVDIDWGWLNAARQVFMAGAFLALYILIESLWKREQSPVKKLGFGMVLVVPVVIGVSLLSLVISDSFDVKNNTLIPTGFTAVASANIYGVVLGSTMLLVGMILRDLILVRRKKGTWRNLLILAGLLFASALSTLPYAQLETAIFPALLFGLGILAMVYNSFRLTWIVYLSKREKLFSLTYGFVLLCVFILLAVAIFGDGSIGKAVLFYSRPLRALIGGMAIWGAVYFGMTFASTLFHLPTAEAFDRKSTEVSSLHNLSRLVTQVFDFNELVDSVTKMTLEVCEAKSSWLEIVNVPPALPASRALFGAVQTDHIGETVSLKNISREETGAIMSAGGDAIRKLAMDNRKAIVIDSVRQDTRTQDLAGVNNKFGSMVVVPLLSHEKVLGVLYATKDMEYGFDKEDVELISAFADQATIAIENSRLIEKSLERERLMREMMLAQDMQRKLLPQSLPGIVGVDIDALSSPAFEVGGDYYDFTMLDEHHLGILVGDVSGKGVSAAFYMAEMKGIFQSLSKIDRSPAKFLSSAHEALIDTIDKRSFISLIYGVLDLRTGAMTVARAGHCPMLFRSGSGTVYVKPTGLGLGMGSTHFFRKTIAEETITFSEGDYAVFYTDGVTEARAKSGDEFGYERLQEVVRSAEAHSAVAMRDAIVMAVDRHMEHEAPEDDLTLVVVRWTGRKQ